MILHFKKRRRLYLVVSLILSACAFFIAGCGDDSSSTTKTYVTPTPDSGKGLVSGVLLVQNSSCAVQSVLMNIYNTNGDLLYSDICVAGSRFDKNLSPGTYDITFISTPCIYSIQVTVTSGQSLTISPILN